MWEEGVQETWRQEAAQRSSVKWSVIVEFRGRVFWLSECYCHLRSIGTVATPEIVWSLRDGMFPPKSFRFILWRGCFFLEVGQQFESNSGQRNIKIFRKVQVVSLSVIVYSSIYNDYPWSFQSWKSLPRENDRSETGGDVHILRGKAVATLPTHE